MLSQETISLIAFNLMPGIGNVTTKKLIDHFRSAEVALNASYRELSKVVGITSSLVRKIVEERDKLPLEKELELIDKHSCELITINNDAYPPLLRNIYDPPNVLYVKGNLPSPESSAFAIVGTRGATSYGLNTCRELSQQLASRGITIVSGLATGVDTFAHQGALDAGGHTIAVMGNGLSRVYPAENIDLANQIVESSGALISEYPMEMAPLGKNFPPRNRIISGISIGVLVVEATEFSGSLITARHAAEQGRDVFAVPGDIRSAASKGTNRLIDEGAKLVRDVDDILSELPKFSWTSATDKIEKPPTRVQKEQIPKKPKLQLTEEEKKIYDQINPPSTHIDELVRSTGFPPGKVSSILLQLELKGAVEQLPGKHFTKK